MVDGEIPVTLPNEAALRQALEAAGIVFVEDNGGGGGALRSVLKGLMGSALLRQHGQHSSRCPIRERNWDLPVNHFCSPDRRYPDF